MFVTVALSLSANVQIKAPEAPKTPEAVQFLSGSHSLGAHVFEKIVSNGLLKLHNTTVTQSIRVNGTLIAQAARLNSLDLSGDGSLSDTIVSEPCVIVGALRTQNCTFHGPLTLGVQKAHFSGSKVGAITIRKDLSYKGKQLIELKQRTVVDGPITFESGRGEVHVYPGSQVLGAVTGGKVIKKN
jgi:hypothetical protein